MVNVCMFTNLYPPIVSGSATQSAALARELARRGHTVTVITAKVSPGNKDYEQIDGAHIYRLPAIRLPQAAIALNFPWLNVTFTPANQSRIQQIINKHQPDILHLHNHMFDLGFSAVRMARKYHLPLVVTIHTLIRHPRRFYNLFLYPADRWLLKRMIIDRADVLVCPDLTIQEYVFNAFGKEMVTLIPYGIDLPSQADQVRLESIKQKYHLSGGPMILSLGHVHDIRNRKDLIKAMPKVLEHFPDAKLVVVGAVGTETAQALVDRLGLSGAVVFTGAVSHSEAVAFLRMADLEAHWFQGSNPQTRTLGIAALEAMAAGKAILNTADENIYGEGVLRDGQNYVRVELRQPERIAQIIIELLSDEQKRKAIGERAQQTIREHFSWDIVCAKTLEAYCQSIKKGDGNA